MRHKVIAASAVFALVTGTLASLLILRDRQDALRHVEERTASMARMIVAHGDSVLDAAQSIITTITPLVALWDLQDEQQGETIFAEIHKPIDGNQVLSSAWIMDAKGISRLDTWSYPSKPIDGSMRPYFQAHLAGADDPIILGDDRPGTVSGKQRFTYSAAVRHPDGSLKAVIVVGIYRSSFDVLYGEAATWPGATAGLQTVSAKPLARFEQGGDVTSAAFLQLLTAEALKADNGSILIENEGEPRLTSWKRSARHPQVYGSSSQTVTEALSDWRDRSWTIGILTLAANLAFIAFVFYANRAAEARQAAMANELAVREVNHRVKNSLQLISSLVQMRARKTDDEGYRTATRDMVNHLNAVAETYRFVQSSPSLDKVNLGKALEGLCAHLQDSYDTPVELSAPVLIHIDASHATTLAIIINELVTNAIKHGDGKVKVSCNQDQDTLRIAVANTGSILPDGFSLDTTTGFGLKAVKAMVNGLGGKVTAERISTGGAVFDVALPMSGLIAATG